MTAEPTLDVMSVLEKVREDTTAAMKAGEKERVGALRMIVNELQKAEKEGGGDELAVLQRERKLIAGYLPEQLSDEELRAIVGDVIAESGASSPKEMGQVMSQVMPKVEGRADGKRVSGLVKELLTP